MGFPQDLLEQAEHLVQRERKKPRQASLRRAVSTAYYVLFHLLIEETTKNWKGAGATTDKLRQRQILARMFEHQSMRAACQRRVKDIDKNQGSHLSDAVVKIKRVAETFVTMQNDRHAADYDGSKKWTRTQAGQKVDSVARAFREWTGIRDDPAAQEFLVSLLLKERKG